MFPIGGRDLTKLLGDEGEISENDVNGDGFIGTQTSAGWEPFTSKTVSTLFIQFLFNFI